MKVLYEFKRQQQAGPICPQSTLKGMKIQALSRPLSVLGSFEMHPAHFLPFSKLLQAGCCPIIKPSATLNFSEQAMEEQEAGEQRTQYKLHLAGETASLGRQPHRPLPPSIPCCCFLAWFLVCRRVCCVWHELNHQ